MQHKPDWLPEQTDLNAFHTKLLLIASSNGSLKACKNSLCRVLPRRSVVVKCVETSVLSITIFFELLEMHC